MALHGILRATMDVDLVLNLKKDDFVKFHEAMKDLSLSALQPFLPTQLIEFRKEYIAERNLIAWSFVNYRDPSEAVDVLIIEDLANIKTVEVSVGNIEVSVVSLKDLMSMKENSGRPQDLLDLEKLKHLSEEMKQSEKRKPSAKDILLERGQSNLKNLQFLEDMRVLSSNVSSRLKLISIKMPEDLLRAFKFACENQNIKYQTQIKKLMAEWLDKVN